MTLKPAANAPITCTDWGNLADEDGFLALGRNRYHCVYVVYTDGNWYYAENGTTGALDYGGPSGNGGAAGNNAAAVIQAVLDAMGANGGLLFMKRGTYTITATIAPTSGDFEIIGEGRENTVLQLGFNGHLLQVNSVDNITIRDLSMDGEKATYATDAWVGGLFQIVDNLLVENCDFYDFAGKGVFARKVSDSMFNDCRFYSNTQDGLYLESEVAPGDPSERVVVNSCIAYSNTRKGFNNGHVKDIIYNDCFSYSNTEDGWNIEGSADDSYQLRNIALIGCKSFSNTIWGFRVQQICYNVIIDGCEAYSNGSGGLSLRGNDTYPMSNVTVSNSSFYLNETDGVNIQYGIHYLKITSVSVFNNDQGETNTDGIAFGFTDHIEHVIIDNVHAYDDQLVATQDRGIDFGAVDHIGKNFYVRCISGDGNTTELFRGLGVDVPIIVVPFVDGSDPQDSGYEIDLAAEYARTYLVLPPEVNQVLRIKIYARSVVTEADAMRVETVILGGADNEPYNTHVGSEANLASESTNFAADDVIYWICSPAGVTALTGGDSVEIKVLHEIAGGADCQTDAFFRTASIEYV